MLTTDKFVERAQTVHFQRYDYSTTNFAGYRNKLTIVCRIHGAFDQVAERHLRGQGCARCGNTKKAYTAETFRVAAQAIYGNKYDYSKVEYVNSKTKVLIGCPTHGYVLNKPEKHLGGSGCPLCGRTERGQARRLTREQFLLKAQAIHGNLYSYDTAIYLNRSTPIEIICAKHGAFTVLAETHLSGHGCRKCSEERITHTKETFVKAAQAIHGKKYDYSEVHYINAQSKVKVICPTHGHFYQKPNNHLLGKGCKACAGIATPSYTDVLGKFRKAHGTQYDYGRANYVNLTTKIEIICPSHGPFFQQPNHHIKGHGCKKCADDNNPGNGHKLSQWVAVQKDRLARLYFIECTRDNETFLKLGITLTPMKNRITQIPYDCKVLWLLESPDADFIWKTERLLKTEFKPYRYQPSIVFGGHTECFQVGSLDIIKARLNII